MGNGYISGVVTEIINPLNKAVCYTVYNFAKHMKFNALTEDINSVEGLKWLDKIQPDLGIMMGYPKRLTKEVIDRFSKFILNIHPSDLPKHRGGFPLHQQIIQNDPLVITIHKVDARLDAGPWTYKTSPLDLSCLTSEEVYGLVKQQATLAMLAILEKISKYQDLSFYEQNELSASYATRVTTTKSLQRIDWNDDIDRICTIIRAVGTRLGISVSLNTQSGRKIEAKIHSAYALHMKHDYSPGQLLSYENGSYQVAAKNGFVIIEDLRCGRGKSLVLKSCSIDKIEKLGSINKKAVL